jgi:putative tricarboxylic transport membrane protein
VRAQKSKFHGIKAYPNMRADLYTAPILFLLGTAMTYGGWTMERLEIRQIHPASIPGLTPMLLGIALAIASIVLFIQARTHSPISEASHSDPQPASGSRRDLFVAASLCVLYSIGLVGNIPFAVATALFIAAFVFAFEADPGKGRTHIIKIAAIAITLGIILAAAMSVLFRYAFLVRLP